MKIAISDSPIEAPSSIVETTGAPAPRVPALIAGRETIFPLCTSPETTMPRTMPTHWLFCIQVDLSRLSAAVVAAKISPPMLGRMKLWIASLIVSTAGILSRTTSASNRMLPIPMAHQLSIQLKLAGSVSTSVKRAISATMRKGM